MKILFLSTIFPDRLHPARGTFNFELCSSLQKAGAEVQVIAPQAWPEVVRLRFAGKRIAPTESIQTKELPVHYPVYWYPPKVLRHHYSHYYWLSIRWTVKKVLQNWTPDLILSYWAHPDGAVALKLAAMTGAPSGVIIGGSDVLLLPKWKSRKTQVTQVLKNSDAVLTVSRGLTEVVESLGARPDTVHTVYQGTDPERFYPGNQQQARQALGLDLSQQLLIWVGRMVKIKNLDLLIQAVEIKARQHRNFKLCLLGDGPEVLRIRQMIAEKQLADVVELVGSVGHDKLPDWYRAADVVLLSSHSEGLPNVLREAVACGVPFVSTNVGSIAEIADPACSLLVPSGDAALFAEAIETVLSGPYRKHAGQLKSRTWDDMAADVLAIFQESLPPKQRYHTKQTSERACFPENPPECSRSMDVFSC